MPSRVLAGFLCCLLLTACRSADIEPWPPSPNQTPDEQLAADHMVVSANPHASRIGRDILRQGGNAVDAAIAMQIALTFVEPPESGIGGGAFMLYRSGDGEVLGVYDGRETAPAAATADRFTVLGRRQPLWAVIPSGKAVGVPGTVALLHAAHQDHGELPWAELFEPTIALARDGIEMPLRLQEQAQRDVTLRLYADTRRYFRGQLRQDPPQLRNAELADTLQRIADDGPDAFYRGPLAEEIVAAAGARWPGRGDLTTDDLAEYQALVRDAVCAEYRGWRLCGPPPPSSGGIAVLQILGMLEHFDLPSMGPESSDAIHLIIEASRLAFADRFRYVGDPDFVDVPTAALVDPDYLRQRAELIDPAKAKERPLPGLPGVRPELPDVPDPLDEETAEDTSHFAVVDSKGNVVSMTSSIEAPFGSRIMVGGFLLNNQLTDFTFQAVQNGVEVANAVAPGKRPRSSMSPFIVLDEDDRIRLIIGSRGGSRIIGYVVKALIGVLDWELSVQEAISLPNMVYRGRGLELEQGTPLEDVAQTLRALGHDVRVVPMRSGIHGIERTNEGWRGGADPRLDGTAIGD
ncbi:gamma-glutamyltransferase [Methylonatrum kenyense]|uniref:gamma-glutamyltransferase n=1 Tax=Methylonatrum kenyense TaxID=455253 RepID=UPI0020BDA230|nr:gamma-glutamyltransferase [Methylonatrum kenyense]MCK8515123.1 gamma-glutamyltransferase [Methylonatrum kenyense]